MTNSPRSTRHLRRCETWRRSKTDGASDAIKGWEKWTRGRWQKTLLLNLGVCRKLFLTRLSSFCRDLLNPLGAQHSSPSLTSRGKSGLYFFALRLFACRLIHYRLRKGVGVHTHVLVAGSTTCARPDFKLTHYLLLAGKAESDGGAGLVQQVHDSAGVGVGDDGAFGVAGAEEVAEVRGFVVEAIAEDRVVKLEGRSADARDGGARRVPPGLVNGGKAAGSGEGGDAGRGERKASVELREALLVAGLDQGEGVDRGSVGNDRRHVAEGLHVGGGAEPIDGKESLIDADGHKGSAGARGAPGGVLGRGVGAGVAGLDEGDRAETALLGLGISLSFG